MSGASEYSAVEPLRDGRRVEIRALKPDDREGSSRRSAAPASPSTAVSAQNATSSEREIAFFLNVDFVNHVALVAVLEEDGRPVIIAGGRYVVVQPGKAEVAFAVVDRYQGRGIGAALLRHLAAIARAAGLTELIAEVLPENTAMLKVFEKGLHVSTTREPRVVHVALGLA